MISFTTRGSTIKTEKFLATIKRQEMFKGLEGLAQEGVNALIAATPKDSGETASKWGYKITPSRGRYTITWTNTSINEGTNIAIILQYGHGTGTGGYVEGRDYINPALRPVFDKIADKAWKAVTSA